MYAESLQLSLIAEIKLSQLVAQCINASFGTVGTYVHNLIYFHFDLFLIQFNLI